jgi:acetyl esterase/lipase
VLTLNEKGDIGMKYWISLLSLLFVVSAFAAPKTENLYKKVPLAKGTGGGDTPTITLYLADDEKATGTAVVVCPGGGYGGLAMHHEGHQVAKWLNSVGVSAFILKYRLGSKYNHPVPLMDAQRAIRTIRARAEEFNIYPDRIGILGFSAGGHLASTAGTHFDDGKPNGDDIDKVSSRPDFMVLVYPVITMDDKYTHRGSKRNLLGENPDEKLVTHLSNETQVTENTPPTFLILSHEDKAVPSPNGVGFYLALHKSGVPAEMHVYEKGAHGFGLAPFDPILGQWPDVCITWLKGRGLLE